MIRTYTTNGVVGMFFVDIATAKDSATTHIQTYTDSTLNLTT